MDYTGIIKNIKKHIHLNEQEISLFETLVSFKPVSRKSIIQQEGATCKYLNYVHSGALRAYYLDKDAKESTIMFAINDWWVTDMYAFLNRQPAMMYIEAIEDSHIIQLSRENFDLIFERIPKFERFFRILMQNAYVREQLRSIENLSLTAEEKYKRFLDRYPRIAETVTQKQIASYLGITPEFLSTIRSKWSRKPIS